jgi:hypothetical protein
MKDVRKYHWALYFIAVLITLVSNFFPAIYSTQPIIHPRDYFVIYFFGLGFQGEKGYSFIPLVYSFFPLILLMISIVKISYLAFKLARGQKIDSINILIYATLLLGAIVSYFLIITLSMSGIADRLYLIWEWADPGFGLIGPVIGAIITYLGYFLGEDK